MNHAEGAGVLEAELCELMGYGGPPEVEFLGETWKIHADGLAPLLRYARATMTPREASQQPGTVPLAALFRLLEDCVIDFGRFSEAALAAKAQAEDIMPVTEQLIRFYCARSHWPAMRLIGFIASSLEEIDGNFLKAGGRGLASLSAREACNLALAVCLDGRDEDDRQMFLEDLNWEGNPETDALEMVRQMRAAKAEAAAAEAAGG